VCYFRDGSLKTIGRFSVLPISRTLLYFRFKISPQRLAAPGARWDFLINAVNTFCTLSRERSHSVGNRIRKQKLMGPERFRLPIQRSAADVLKLQEALKMLYELLEGYAPSWYTEEHHDRAEAALGKTGNDEVMENSSTEPMLTYKLSESEFRCSFCEQEVAVSDNIGFTAHGISDLIEAFNGHVARYHDTRKQTKTSKRA